MIKPYLTDDEIAELTSPLTQGAARIKFFESLGIKVKPKPNGQPIVGRAEFEAAMLARGRQAVAPANDRVVRPDWQSLRGFKRAS